MSEQKVRRSEAFDRAVQDMGGALLMKDAPQQLVRVLEKFRDGYRKELLQSSTVGLSAADRTARQRRYAQAVHDDAERPKNAWRGINSGVMEVADEEQLELREEIERLKDENGRLMDQRQQMAEERFVWQTRGDRASIAVCREIAARLVSKALFVAEDQEDLDAAAVKERITEAKILDREAEELRQLADRREEDLPPSVTNPDLHAVATEALIRWVDRSGDPKYASSRSSEVVRANNKARAEAVLGAILNHLDVTDAQAWCKSCRRAWEGPGHYCASDAERRLSRLRENHAGVCPLKGGSSAFTCGTCDILNAPGAGEFRPVDTGEVEEALRDVLGQIRPQGHPGWKLNTCLVTNDQLIRWRQVAGLPSNPR